MVCLHTLQQFQKLLDAILDNPLAHIESTHHPPILAKIKIYLEIYILWLGEIDFDIRCASTSWRVGTI